MSESAPSTQAKPTTPPTRTASPEALDQITETTTPHGWWALWAITGAVAIALVWSFVATIPQQATATGVVSSFNYSRSISATASGILSWAEASRGPLTADTVVATITPFDGSPEVEVKAGIDGSVSSLYEMEGAGVEAGKALGTIVTEPDPNAGIIVLTYVPESEALTFSVGESAQVSLTEVNTGKSFVTKATIEDVADSAANEEGILTAAGSLSLAQQWMSEADGLPYRVVLRITDWPSDNPAGIPGAGQIVNIVNTYGSIHPIQLLFGGN